ncbi:MAG: DNA-3-methyladenine glycosylase [Candidatus Peribacteria bacterium]|nr:MAG: DNA-3-methyladenine glycosylase [Candidatus Peribacteria bacterium]
MKLLPSFFQDTSTVELARALLGKVFVYETSLGIISGVINETEAYNEEDEASHTFGGNRTPRNEVMFWEGGHLYVYFTYGMYHCMNVVSESADYGSAVLIRSVIPVEGMEIMTKYRYGDTPIPVFPLTGERGKRGSKKNLCNGPGKLCIALGITKEQNGANLCTKDSKIYLEERGYHFSEIVTTSRIGISKGQEKMWRFYAKEEDLKREEK